ncbi:MAG: mandelate racemase/muconate lactonizing enzyme family protein [Chloroflexota bacterium]
MRITDIRVYIPMVGLRPQCLVKVETDAGIHGWGESGLTAREEAVEAAIGHFRSFLVGADPMERGRIWQRLYRSQYFEGGRVLLAAQSAIDIALHDIAGKALGVPVHQLLGGRQRDFVPLFATTGAPPGPRLVEDAQRLVAEGWTSLRFSPGGPIHADDPDRFDPRDAVPLTAEWAVKVRAAIGPGPTLGIDWHHRLSIPETVAFVNRMPRGTVDYIEEPIRAESPAAYAQLRALIDVPLAIGEEFSSKWAFAPFIEQGLTDHVRVDVCNVGGLTEAMKVAAMAEARYLDLMPHHPLGPICGAATAHLCLAAPNVSAMEIRRSPTEDLGFYDARLFPVQPRQEGPRLYLDDRPGIGVEVDEAAVAERAARWQVPQLHRDDGSVQNW